MPSSQKSCILLLAIAAVCIQLYHAHDIIGRCSCPNTVKFLKANISDFRVLERRPGCDRIELIVTILNPDNSTDRVCMNTEGRKAKGFLRCWERINKDESRKTECIDRKRKAE